MRINTKKLLEAGKARGIEPYSVGFSTSKSTSVSVFNGEVESQEIGTTQDIGARGLFNGRIGSFSTDAIDNKTSSLLAEKVLESAQFGKEDKAEHFFKGGLRYSPLKKPASPFVPATLKELREFALALSKKVQAADKRVSKVEVGVSMDEIDGKKFNSLGLKCSSSIKCYSGAISVIAEDEDKEPRSSYESFISFISLEDLSAEADKVIDKVIHESVDFFKSKPAKGANYKAVLDPSVIKSLFPFYISHCNAKSVQKHLSVLEGKIDTEIMSKCITIKHTPHILSLSASAYDADGYPTKDFTLVSKGVLKTYFYSLETALEEKIESNGCASGDGNGSYKVLTVTPGKKRKEELFAKMKNGLYITDVSGLNSGINGQTLDFSLPCQGYIIKDGKIDRAISMNVVAGNLKDLFSSVIALGSDTDYRGSIITPSMLVKKIIVSGN